MAGVMLFASPLSGRVLGTRGSRPSLVIGGVGVLTGALLLTGLTPTTPEGLLFTAYVIFGLGSGFVNPPITNTAVSGMPPSMAGIAAAIASTSRQVGSTLGVAVLGALAGGAATGSVSRGFPQATHVSWWIVVGLGVTVLVLGIVTTTQWARATAVRTAKAMQERTRECGGEKPAGELVTH
jgi:MFS family permease